MTQASLSYSLVLKWLVSICVSFAISFLNFVEPYRVWTSVYFNSALCTLWLCLDMFMLALLLSIHDMYLVHAMLGFYCWWGSSL
jgi:hypothetical protein